MKVGPSLLSLVISSVVNGGDMYLGGSNVLHCVLWQSCGKGLRRASLTSLMIHILVS